MRLIFLNHVKEDIESNMAIEIKMETENMADETSKDGCGKECQYMGRQSIETFISLLTPKRGYRIRRSIYNIYTYSEKNLSIKSI
jgi:hypothetical protein